MVSLIHNGYVLTLLSSLEELLCAENDSPHSSAEDCITVLRPISRILLARQ